MFSVHYSERFNNADNFLLQCMDKLLVDNAKYLTQTNNEDIIKLFIKNSIQEHNKSINNNPYDIYMETIFN